MAGSNMIAVNARELRNALAFVVQTVERWNVIPILGTVRITAHDDRVNLRATDLDIELEMTVPAEVEGNFDITMSPRWLRGLIQWHDGMVTIASREDGGETIATIEAGDVWAEARCLSAAADWPAFLGEGRDVLPGEGWKEPVTLSEAALRRALDAVVVSISTEETRYYLNGAYAHTIDGELRLVSTDGHRLSLYDTGEAWAGLGAIVPRKTIGILQRRLIKGGNAGVEVSQLIRMEPKRPAQTATAGKGAKVRTEPEPKPEMVPWAAAMRFIGDGWSITSKMIDGTYPDYTRVIPTPSDAIAVTVSADALRRFPTASDDCGGRAIAINGDAGTMSQRDAEGNVVRMPVQGHGKPFGINLGYLRAFARQSGTIRLTGTGPGDPFRVLSEDPKLLQVIMPMRV